MNITQILSSVQHTSATHHKYVKELEDLLKKDGVDTFFKDFKRYLIIAFNKDLKIKNPFVDRFYDFCISFIDTIESKSSDSDTSVFVTKIFDAILNCLEVISPDIRYHASLFIHKYLLYLVKKDKTINEILYEKITEAILDTLEDINPQIRIISANILKLLQDSEGSEDPFSSAFIDNLDDSNGKVRAALVDALVATSDNLPHIIGRCRDVDEHVRITVFKKVADVPVQMFTIEQRQFLLKNGLKDRSERVNKCLETTVLPAWLKYYECDYIKFLKALQLDSNKKEIDDTKIVSQLLLKSLFSSRPIQEILEVLILEEKLIRLEQLTWESAFFWKTLIHHLKTKNLEQYWELILPETVLFCNYIEKFCSESNLITGSVWEQQHYLLIFHELLCIVLGCDITDEASRRRLHSFLVKTLKERKVSEEIIKDIVKYFDVLIPNVDQRVNFFCEMISDIRTPLVPAASSEQINEIEEKKREINQKLKKLLIEKAKTIEDQDFEKTKQIVFEITSTKEILQSFEETSTLSNEEEPQEKSNDPELIIKCLDITFAFLQSTQIMSINPALKSLKEEIFMEIMTCKNTTIQEKYFRCYGVICSLNKTTAEENIQFFCLPLSLYTKDRSGETEIITAVIDVVGDLILIYGTKILPMNISNEDSNASLDFELIYGKCETTLNDVVDILSLMLDDTNIVIQLSACEVLIKLMLTKRIESPELFSRLVIKWLSPASAEKVRFRQTIGVFIEKFSQLHDVEQQLEDSVIPILRTISLAPVTSPLINVSKEELLKLIIKIINLRQDMDYTIHENLAMNICKEIQKDYDSKCVPLFVKALLFLELFRDDNVYIDNLLNICEDILIELKDRFSINNMKKFIYSLKHE